MWGTAENLASYTFLLEMGLKKKFSFTFPSHPQFKGFWVCAKIQNPTAQQILVPQVPIFPSCPTLTMDCSTD